MFKSSIVITGISLLGSGLGLSVQLLIAYKFGAGVAVDTYLFAISFPTFLAGLVSTSFAYSLVSKIAGFEKSIEERRRFIGVILLGTLGLALFLIVFGITLVEVQLSILPGQSSIWYATDLMTMMYAGWILCGVQVILSCLIAILNGTGRFFSAAFLGLAPYLGIIAAIAVSSNESTLAIIVGMVLGSIVSSMLAIILVHGDIKLCSKTRIPWFRVLEFAYSAPFTILSTSCFSVYVIIDSYWAPFAGTGILSNLGYAQRILIAIGNLAVVGPFTLIGNRLAILLAAGDLVAFRRVTFYTVGIVFLIGIFLVAGIGLAAEPMIELFFFRGAFGTDDVKALASTIKYMAPGMVGMLVSAVLLKAIFVLPGSGWSTAMIGLFWPVLYFILSGLWIERGSLGIAAAYSVTWCLIAIVFAGAIVLKVK